MRLAVTSGWRRARVRSVATAVTVSSIAASAMVVGSAWSATPASARYQVTFVFESDLGSVPLNWTRACVRVAGSSRKFCKIAAELPRVANPTNSCNATGGSITFCNVLIPRRNPVGKVVLVSVRLTSRYCKNVVPMGLPVENTGVGDDVIPVNRRIRGVGVTRVTVRCT